MTPADHRHLLAIAEEAARAAGEGLTRATAAWKTINFEDRKDIKMQADIEAEHIIREALDGKTRFPVIGEEEGGDVSLTGRQEPYWVVDPLDGTHNYARDLPVCAVSIGLMRGETPVLGTILDFNREECFSGIVAEGYWINGESHQPEWADDIAKASLATGFPAGRDYGEEALAAFISRIRQFRKIRSFGSAAMHLAYVSCGRVDAYCEESIRLWDVAGGLALVQAAGGVIRMQPVNRESLTYDVWAAGDPAFLPR